MKESKKSGKIFDNIKSLYIEKEIFLFLDEKKKLNIIMYNKLIQKLLEIDFEYYKKISGKYKEIEKNGKGK